MTNATARCAIRTKYHGATNYKPSRIIATGELGKVTVSYDHALDSTWTIKTGFASIIVITGLGKSQARVR